VVEQVLMLLLLVASLETLEVEVLMLVEVEAN
jgi:hypothetical protein